MSRRACRCGRSSVTLALVSTLGSMGCRAPEPRASGPGGHVSSRAEPELVSTLADVPFELGLMWPNFPEGRAPDEREVKLGRELFFERRLSSDNSVSCDNCHEPDHGFADPRRVSIGIEGRKGRRNSSTLWNAAYFENLGWVGEHDSIEEQSLAAITNPDEMGMRREEMAAKLGPLYGERLQAIYGEVSPEAIARALGAYQRTLVAGDSAFDRYIYGGEEGAVSDAAKHGFAVFIGQARCIQCHFMRSEASHPFGGSTGTFTDNRFHNIGVGFDEQGNTGDVGREEATRQVTDRGAFKTPTLRNIALTAPYMHDGSLATLKDVVDHYNKGGVPNPNLDFDVKPLNLTDRDKADLVAFMESLTSVKLAKASLDVNPPKSSSARSLGTKTLVAK